MNSGGSISKSLKTIKLALCQIPVTDNKMTNLKAAEKSIRSAAAQGATIISLPECFNSPYATKSFPLYAEEIPSNVSDWSTADQPSAALLARLASELSIYLIGGSIPERVVSSQATSQERIFNTCLVLDPSGDLVAKHRKMHLFDIDVPGQITFKESDTLSAGSDLVTFKTSECTVGLGICYDIRFPELSMLLSQKGASLLVFPGAFNMTTGPAHWELLARARAIDNQLFVATVSPARDVTTRDGYKAWGHSTIVSPWGEVIATTDHTPGIVFASLELAQVEDMRRNIPTSQQKRSDIYMLKEV